MNSPQTTNGTQAKPKDGDIAIIGMACMFPGAPDLDAYWHNILTKVDAVTDPPTEAWDSATYYDADSASNDKVYCQKGGYLGPLAQFDPIEHGIPPVSVGGEPDQWLALKVAREALTDAGYPDGPQDGHQTSVIIGKGTYLNHGNLTITQHSLVVGQTLEILKTLHPEYTADDIETIKAELQATLPKVSAETVPGHIPNVIAGRIANRLDLMGPSFTVDAACASSLVAVDIAMRDLRSGRCDTAIVGGSQITTPLPVFGIFCQLNALSHKQQIRPFDKDADGTILGEGIGMVILKRREDAERDGDRIYCVIKGVGTASDGHGLSVMAPRVEGEELALRRAYEMAGISPRTVGLIEAHGTATAAGDVAEIQALANVFGGREADELPWCGLGTVKSMIGHTLPAAGIAGLIKIALALHHKVLPPTINCDEPNPKLELEKTPFYLNTETRPWIHADSHTPRRAEVNAFGFGGINAHVVLEEYPDTRAVPSVSHDLNWETEVVTLQGDSRDALIEQAEQLVRSLMTSPDVSLKDVAYTLNTALVDSTHRLAVVASSVDDLQKKLKKALERLSDPNCHQIKDRGGIYFFEQPLGREGKLAFLFPGEGSQYTNMLADLSEHFPEVRACFDQIDRIYADHPRKYLPSDFIFPRPMASEEERELAEQRLWQIDGAVEGVLTANHALFTLLSLLDIRPDAILGHSTGEYSAMRASGVFDFSDEAAFKQFSLDLNRMYEEEAAQDGVPRATLIALGASQAQASEIANQVGGNIYVAMDNCPHQAVIVGEKRAAEQVLNRVQEQGLIYQVLPFDRAYHTPLFEPYLHGLRDFFSRFPVSLPNINTWSCTTMSPYPNDVDEIRRLTVDHWMRPVEFRKTIEAMHADGVRIFVEVGARSNLTSFVDDTLRDQTYLAVPSNVERRSGITQINHMVGLLAAQGIHMKLDYLYERRTPKKLSLDAATDSNDAKVKPRLPMKLDTGWPKMSISNELAARLRSRTDEQAATPVESEKNGAESSAKSEQAAEVQTPPVAAEQPAIQPAQVVETPTPPQTEAMQQRPVQTARSAAYASRPMDAYLETMERFLDTQQEVMQAFLGVTRTPRAVDASEARQPAQQLPVEAQPPEPPLVEPSEAPSVEVVPVETQPTTPQPEIVTQAMSAASIKDNLLELVSQRTGYPVDMLDLNMDMEADLGIDSIKRVEIMGVFRAEYGVLQDHHIESISELKTLQHIINLLETAANEFEGETVSGKERPGPESGIQIETNSASPSLPIDFPLLGRVQVLVPGRELVTIKQVSWDEDLYLHDHTLGREISGSESGPRPLSVVPLTMSMEILAEAGSLLMPNKLIIGMRDIRAHKWIALEGEVVNLEIRANSTELQGEVRVEIREIGSDDPNKAALDMPLVEGTVVFGDAYPTPPATGDFSFRNERPSRLAGWPTKRLYDELMFHGPRWQGVKSVDSWGEDGNIATFEVLETEEFFSSTTDPGFVTDPIVLDAAGQIVGFWTMEHLESDRMVFPYHVEELHVYGPGLPVGNLVRCEARINLIGDKLVTSDIDMIAPDGRLWMRLVGWKDKRFDLPETLHRAMLSVKDNIISNKWELPVSSFPKAESFQCFRLDKVFESDKAFWTQVWTHIVLTESERKTFSELRTPEIRQTEWLLSRIASKDAVRAYMKQKHGIVLCPADIEIGHDDYGQPIPRGKWTSEVEDIPRLSLAHTDGMAFAVAGLPENGMGIGVDIERIRTQPDGFDEVAFLPEERAMLDSIEPMLRDEWAMRFWCAKEAVGKGLGRGVQEGPHAVAVLEMDVESGIVRACPRGKLAEEFPEYAEAGIIVYTSQEDGYAIAATLCEKELSA